MDQKKHEAIDQFCLGCALLIFTFNTAKLSIKDIILRNFLAKAVAQLRSVTILNSVGNTFDCFILYRAMVDRLAHIYYLHRTKSFQMFDDWSFMRQYEANHNSLSAPDFKDRIDKEYFQSSETDKARYKRLQHMNVEWKRPKALDEFKIKDLSFLYKLGYDHASTHVHPMANDGSIEYFKMLPNVSKEIVDHDAYQANIITQNSTLIASLTANECLNVSSFKWRRVVFNFISSFREAMNDKPNEFELNFYKLHKFLDNNEPLGEIDSNKPD